MRENLEILLYSADNKEDILDFETNHFYWHLDLNIEKIDTFLRNTNNIRIILQKIKNEFKNKHLIDKNILLELDKNIRTHSICSPFVMFFSVCDITLSIYNKLSEEERLSLLSKLVFLFIERRDIYSEIDRSTAIGILDQRASRRQGNAGQNKLKFILENKCNFKHCININQIKNKEFLLITENNWNSIRNILDIKYTVAEGKKPDILIKKKDEFYIVEAKHIKESGGSQDKQISELIKIISINEGIHYVAFLDGIYSNLLLKAGNLKKYIDLTLKPNQKDKKHHKQAYEIYRKIYENPNNYFLNTKGFIKLFCNAD